MKEPNQLSTTTTKCCLLIFGKQMQLKICFLTVTDYLFWYFLIVILRLQILSIRSLRNMAVPTIGCPYMQLDLKNSVFAEMAVLLSRRNTFRWMLTGTCGLYMIPKCSHFLIAACMSNFPINQQAYNLHNCRVVFMNVFNLNSDIATSINTSSGLGKQMRSKRDRRTKFEHKRSFWLSGSDVGISPSGTQMHAWETEQLQQNNWPKQQEKKTEFIQNTSVQH